MKSKERIKTLINILEDSNINSMEVSSFWGFIKIKLSKELTSTTSTSSENSALSNTSVSEPLHQHQIKEESASQMLPATDTVSIPEPSAEETAGYVQKAPLVGTTYLSAKPGENDFITEGDKVKKGQTICIIEAMKIFNEIEAEEAGTIKTIYIKNEDPVEFGQPLIEIIPD